MDFEKSRSTSTDLDGAQSSAKAREEVRWSSTDLDESKGIAKYAIESEEPHQTSADRDGSRKISEPRLLAKKCSKMAIFTQKI